jgi:hypothetical protein
MSSYHCYSNAGLYNGGRFPDESIGIDRWHDLIRQLPKLQEATTESGVADPLLELRLLHRNNDVKLGIQCPRVFISHRRCDADEALRVNYAVTVPFPVHPNPGHLHMNPHGLPDT